MRPMEFYTPYLKILLCVFELWIVCLSSYSKALAKLNVGEKEPYKRVTKSILILRNVFNGCCLLKGNGSETHDV
jgi:hypothetical protein